MASKRGGFCGGHHLVVDCSNPTPGANKIHLTWAYFHHVEVEDRPEFINGIRRVLKPDSKYLLVCFSDRNGRAWNHFTKEQIAQHFSEKFKLISLDHFVSVEGDGYTRYFYSVLMQPRENLGA